MLLYIQNQCQFSLTELQDWCIEKATVVDGATGRDIVIYAIHQMCKKK